MLAQGAHNDEELDEIPEPPRDPQPFACDYKRDDIVRHHTDGSGFLGIVQSASIYATQVVSLNDICNGAF